MKRKLLLLCGLLSLTLTALANPVTVKMNATSKTMKLEKKETGENIPLPEQTSSQEYVLNLDPGDYWITGIDKNGETVNGKVVLNVTDSTSMQYRTVITCTAYVTNKDDDNNSWTQEKNDYTLNVKVNTREGDVITTVPGNSSTAGRYTFLAFNGNSYNAAFVPSEDHQAQGYMTLYRGGTLTANVNVNGAIPLGGDFSVTVPSDADLELGMKFTHFTDYTMIEPTKVENADGGKIFTYRLANGQVYNYRTWKPGGLTHAGYFTMNLDAANCPEIKFGDEDYAAHSPQAINHDVKSNGGYETGDILLNINPRGHLSLNPGQEFLVHAMRMWEISDNSTNNYFIEPDFHYTVLDTSFKPSNAVVEIKNCSDKNTSAWSKITAKGPGTAIVLVTYDGVNLNYYNKAEKKEYMGGEYWGGIWPENTGVFVVTVGQGESTAEPNMTVNEEYNQDALRLAGKYVDAEHDIFYYLDSEDGFPFTFTPSNVTEIAMASPSVTDRAVTYSGFSAQDVTSNADGSYTLMLRYGRNIIRMVDNAGNAVYQVLSAKPCHREITNESRPGSSIFQPGDKVKIQYSGLFHPANKIAGIYNMSAYVTYNGVPNGSSLILGSGQYTFGSAASAQAVTVEIPVTHDVEKTPILVMDEGVIQVNGYGDPIGNHRNTSPTAGRSPNFTAVPHKTYFGAIPDISIPLTPYKTFQIALEGAPQEADVELTFGGTALKAGEDGNYSGTYGTYGATVKAEGYRCFRQTYEIPDDAEGLITFHVDMEELGGAWDGTAKTEPAKDEDGTYQISTPDELAWFAEHVNAKSTDQNAVLLNDLHLGNFEWTPIGTASASSFTGSFDGRGHTVDGLYINNTKANYQGLFGYMKEDASIAGLSVSGSVSGKQYVGGIVGYMAGNARIDRCANHADVSGTGTYVGGITGSLGAATAEAANLYNTGVVAGTTNCGGVIGYNHKDARISNIFNVGEVKGTDVGGCVGGTTAKDNMTNAFTITEYQVTTGQTTVTLGQMASGEVAYLLGDAFYQTIGEDPYPSFVGLRVYYDDLEDEYYNKAISFAIDPGLGNVNIVVENGVITMPSEFDYRLNVAATPAGSRLPEISWSSSDESVASVDSEGTVSARAKGEAIITAMAMIEDAEATSTCTVKVTGTLSVDEIYELFSRPVDIYDISGRIVKLNASQADLRALAPGIYILRSGSTVKQVLIR